MEVTIDFWESYLYREVWHITKLSAAGEVMKTRSTGKYIHVENIDKIPTAEREMMQFVSISTKVLKQMPIALPLYEVQS